jgi:AcrR family transcriptional regulator
VAAVARDADATRARLIRAAADEFAAHGIAGARVDRIAAAAASNKAQIYHYFESKQGLAAAVFGRFAEESLEQEHFDADDLPETAACIFDQFEDDPRIARIALWMRLESTEVVQEVVDADETKVAAIAAAQRSGVVSPALPAEVLLGFLLTIAATWSALPSEFLGQLDRYDRAARRGFVTEAVRRLVAP